MRASAAGVRPLVAAVDVGGTALKGVLAHVPDGGDIAAPEHDGPEVVAFRQRLTPQGRTPDAVVDAVADLLTELRETPQARHSPVLGTAVVVPGIVHEDRGVAVYAANLGWRDVPVRALLEAKLGHPVTFGQDVRAGGLAEATLGAARGARTALFVPIGTGVAGAILIDGLVLSGDGYAGELGHVVVDPTGEACPCGARGCVETVASASGLARRYHVRTGRRVDGGAGLARRVAEGDVDARAVWDDAVRALADVLTTCAGLLAPEVVVIGGGLGEAGDLLLAPLRRELDARLTLQRRPLLVQAQLGDRAGCLGAALLAAAAGRAPAASGRPAVVASLRGVAG